MTICQFFLQGRCRFGDRCWNEHPGTRGAGGARQPPLQQQQQQPQAAPSGSNRRGWNANSQRYSNVIQPSSFSKSTPWGGSRDQDKPFFGSFDSGPSTSRGFGSPPQNPFASPVSDEQKDEKKLLEGIVKDVEIWESSGQWMFSVFSPVKKKPNISGFTDISPEELRLEYHNFLTSNNLQSYLNSVQQLVSQWKNRINELKNLNMSTKGALLSDIKDGASQAVPPAFGFGSKQSGTFGSSGFPVNNSSSNNVQNFSFKTSSGFSTAPSGSTSAFGSHPAFGAGPSAGSAIASSAPAFGFRKPEATSAASFSFKSPDTSSFGSPGFSGFPASLAVSPFGHAMAPAFGSGSSVPGFGSPGPQSQTVFAKPSNDMFGGSSMSASLPVSATNNVLFTPRDQLTKEELEQFQSQKFTLGKIPLKPPPVELLTV
ncbi:nucleoporin NUP42 isoform X1 [Cricetulus griseus]|uniref:Nucleoporin NUP42 n=2 Tax=Cricetulus griseus TaxID=10029 RepID=A0A8C2ML28_CRIGR|nr:nucleoporin NUP42 isoform X2 [Cricetulus griseus]XP_035315050.1 nucleoporin NUP42 isoform X1 [Cricetulus griseus]